MEPYLLGLLMLLINSAALMVAFRASLRQSVKDAVQQAERLVRIEMKITQIEAHTNGGKTS